MKDIIKNTRLNEEYQRINHPSGLTICLYPMKGYSSAYALFGTKYGSVDTTFKTNADSAFVTVPAGIAHYLEHKLFENEDCGAFELFAKTGANCNAFTSFDKTAYLFSCSQEFEANLEILLDFVQSPYFTDENVEKEQGIIGQEIKMYEDDPSWCVFFNALSALYHNNPVRIDIAGTVESISHINKELLYRCYDTFYNLNNMVLSIAGNFDPEKALAICDRLLKPSEDKGLEVVVPDEPETVFQAEIVKQMPCSIPMFVGMFKFPNYAGREGMTNYIRYNILLEMLFGKTSEFYHRQYEAGLINDSFSASVFNGRGFFALAADGESEQPREVFQKIKDVIQAAQKNGISETAFESIKKKTYGQLVFSYGVVESVAMNMLDAQFNDCSVYDSIEITAETTFTDIEAALKNINIDHAALSIVEPA